MKLTKRKEIWIHREDYSNNLNVCGEYAGVDGKKHFSKPEAKELFECIKEAIQAKYPNIEVNPWGDAEHGTLD